jgi:hypothetical protein
VTGLLRSPPATCYTTAHVGPGDGDLRWSTASIHIYPSRGYGSDCDADGRSTIDRSIDLSRRLLQATGLSIGGCGSYVLVLVPSSVVCKRLSQKRDGSIDDTYLVRAREWTVIDGRDGPMQRLALDLE